MSAGRSYFGLAIVVLGATLAGLVQDLHGLVLGAICAGAGALRSTWEFRELRQLRSVADRKLVRGVAADSSPLLTWRAAEVTSARHQRLLARSVRGVFREATGRTLPGASPLNRAAARQEIGRIQALVDRLADRERPVSPRGLLLVEALLRDGDSPLYARAREDDLRRNLERCLAALESDPRAS